MKALEDVKLCSDCRRHAGSECAGHLGMSLVAARRVCLGQEWERRPPPSDPFPFPEEGRVVTMNETFIDGMRFDPGTYRITRIDPIETDPDDPPF